MIPQAAEKPHGRWGQREANGAELPYDHARLSWEHLQTGRRCDPLALCAEMSSPKRSGLVFLYCNSIASFPGSCIIGNAVKSKQGASKLEPGSVKLIYCGFGGQECWAKSEFSPSPLSPPHPPFKTLVPYTPGPLWRLRFALMLGLTWFTVTYSAYSFTGVLMNKIPEKVLTF